MLVALSKTKAGELEEHLILGRPLPCQVTRAKRHPVGHLQRLPVLVRVEVSAHKHSIYGAIKIHR